MQFFEKIPRNNYVERRIKPKLKGVRHGLVSIVLTAAFLFICYFIKKKFFIKKKKSKNVLRVTISKAAVKQNGLVYSLPRPSRHHNVLCLMNSLQCPRFDRKQGFLTSDGQFVDRIEGARIAIESGQIKGLKWPPKLYTEDLW